jgi:hypothetical protein
MSLQVDFKFFVSIFPFRGLAGVKSDESHWAFTPLGVCTSYDGYLQNIGMGNQLLFNGQTRRILRGYGA